MNQSDKSGRLTCAMNSASLNLAERLFADINLHTGRKRRVILDQEVPGRFERDRPDELVEALRAKKLGTEIK